MVVDSVPPEVAAAVLPELTEGTKPPVFRVSPLDKNAHLRRTVEQLWDDQQRAEAALRLHQRELARHQAILGLQTEAREALRLMMAKHAADLCALLRDQVNNDIAPLHRSFLGRLRWLFLGR